MNNIAINPKEHFEEFKNRNFNKKHKSMNRNVPGIGFDSCAERILSLNDLKSVRSRELQKKLQQRLQVTTEK